LTPSPAKPKHGQPSRSGVASSRACDDLAVLLVALADLLGVDGDRQHVVDHRRRAGRDVVAGEEAVDVEARVDAEAAVLVVLREVAALDLRGEQRRLVVDRVGQHLDRGRHQVVARLALGRARVEPRLDRRNLVVGQRARLLERLRRSRHR
jgi:hypothetical protein